MSTAIFAGTEMETIGAVKGRLYIAKAGGKESLCLKLHLILAESQTGPLQNGGVSNVGSPFVKRRVVLRNITQINLNILRFP